MEGRKLENNKHSQLYSYDFLDALRQYQSDIIQAILSNKQEVIEQSVNRIFISFENCDPKFIFMWMTNSIQEISGYFSFLNLNRISFRIDFTIGKVAQDIIHHTLRVCYLKCLISILKSVEKRRNNSNYALLLEACKMIEKHYYMADLSLHFIAEKLYISYGYLCTIFMKMTGKHFKEHLISTRMSHAENLILSGKYKICEISEMVGYKSPRYFSLTFRNYYGVNPRDYATKE